MLVELTNQECLAGSFNGPSLLETLRSLSAAEAASTDTCEGYSAWAVALHVLYYKNMLATELGAAVPDYDYEKADFPATPANPSQEAWEKLIGRIESTHKAFTAAFSRVSDEALEREHKTFQIPLWRSIAWLVSHDSYHNAQIRNMGLPSLRRSVGT